MFCVTCINVNYSFKYIITNCIYKNFGEPYYAYFQWMDILHGACLTNKIMVPFCHQLEVIPAWIVISDVSTSWPCHCILSYSYT